MGSDPHIFCGAKPCHQVDARDSGAERVGAGEQCNALLRTGKPSRKLSIQMVVRKCSENADTGSAFTNIKPPAHYPCKDRP